MTFIPSESNVEVTRALMYTKEALGEDFIFVPDANGRFYNSNQKIKKVITAGDVYVLDTDLPISGTASPGTEVLSFEGKAGIRYIIDGFIRISNSPSGGAFRIGFSGPAASACFLSASGMGNSATQYVTGGVVNINNLGGPSYGTIVSSGNGILFRGFIIPATDGTVSINIAAVTNPVTALANSSWMRIVEA
jgi:hypothetical protein